MASRTVNDVVLLARDAREAERARSDRSKYQAWPYMIGICGIPGAGKSTLARRVEAEINHQAGTTVCARLPMDGYHYYKKELDAMADPAEAHRRRGAAFTFNALAFVAKLQEIRSHGAATAPEFAHGAGDPVEDAIHITADHCIVLVEGLYLYLNEEPWSQAKDLLDERWFLDIPSDAATARVAARHQQEMGMSPAAALARASGSDKDNGAYLLAAGSRDAATRTIDAWVTTAVAAPHVSKEVRRLYTAWSEGPGRGIAGFVFIRHGNTDKAADATPEADARRALSAKGIKQCARARREWFTKQHLCPHTAVISGALRTKQTFEQLSQPDGDNDDDGNDMYAPQRVLAVPYIYEGLHDAVCASFFDDIGYGTLQQYGARGGRQCMDAYAQKALEHMLTALLQQGEAEGAGQSAHGSLLPVFGHAVHSAALACAAAVLLIADADVLHRALGVIEGVNQGEVQGVAVSADGVVLLGHPQNDQPDAW